MKNLFFGLGVFGFMALACSAEYWADVICRALGV
jgi:hypothetical protein